MEQFITTLFKSQFHNFIDILRTGNHIWTDENNKYGAW